MGNVKERKSQMINPTGFLMKNLIVGIVLSVALIGCADKNQSTPKTTTEKLSAADVDAGKTIAERDCKGCHGVDGRGLAPAIPHLAAQRERYLLASLNEYKDGKRTHAALRDLTGHMSEADMRNVAAYYASQSPVQSAAATDMKHSSPYEQGKALAAACVRCHGDDGNSRIPGTPSLAGQQPHYLVASFQEYHRDDREAAMMKSRLRDSGKLEIESLALYFAVQTPAQRTSPLRGDPAAGEPLTAMCGGCHGEHGVSTDAATPSLAGQDPQYLINATKAYRKTRQNWGMQRYVAALSDKDIENITAFYSVQKSKAADQAPSSTQELAEKCDRCHDTEDNPAIIAPKMRGQDKDYLVMALRAYRDDKRESSTMHRMSTMHMMSVPYSNAIIESLASWYASQPAK
ncbi:MAG: cytochrome c4 [Nitrospirae bacterium]|nr:cytochrome c4 [Nitrospirota bacterium]